MGTFFRATEPFLQAVGSTFSRAEAKGLLCVTKHGLQPSATSDNPGRQHTESTQAELCNAWPLSSGQSSRRSMLDAQVGSNP